MKIDNVLYQRLEKLSKISISGKKERLLKEEINEIMDYLEIINDVNPSYDEIHLNDRRHIGDFREDKAINGFYCMKKRGYYIVPKIQ